MKFRAPMIVAAALAAGLALTACSSSDDNTATPTTAVEETVIVEDESDLPPVPSVEELNAQLQTALDPAVPAEEKAAMVQGLEDDPELIQALSEAADQARADGLIEDIVVTGPILETGTEVISVPFEVTMDGAVNAGDVVIVADGDEWKLGKDSVCGLAELLDIPSESCVADDDVVADEGEFADDDVIIDENN